MKNPLKKAEYQEKTVRVDEVELPEVSWNEGELKEKAAYYLLAPAPKLNLNIEGNGTYVLLAGEKEFLAAKEGGVSEFNARIYRFTNKEKAVYRLAFSIQEANNDMEAAYLMRRLVEEHKLTQEKIARLTGKSRPAVANTLRLLTLEPEVVGLIESGKLSAGHARALVKVPKDKQYPFALETVQRGCSVRETERAVKAFLTPPEVLQSEKDAKAAAKSAELKALVERARSTLGLKVALIGNDKKGRLYIDYQSAEDLYRFEECLEIVEKFRS